MIVRALDFNFQNKIEHDGKDVVSSNAVKYKLSISHIYLKPVQVYPKYLINIHKRRTVWLRYSNTMIIIECFCKIY